MHANQNLNLTLIVIREDKHADAKAPHNKLSAPNVLRAGITAQS